MRIKTVDYFNKGYEGSKFRILSISCIGSLSFSLVLVIANEASEFISEIDWTAEIGWVLVFLSVCAVSIYCKHYTLNRTTAIAQKLIRRERVQLINRLRHTELGFLEQRERGDIYARIVQDTELLSHALPNLIASFEAAISAVAVFLYMAYISLSGFILAASAIVVMNALFIQRYVKIKEKIRCARLKEGDFTDALHGVLSGFKEIKVNTRKNNALFADIVRLSKISETQKAEAETAHDKNIVFAILLSQFVLGIIVFIVPQFSPVYGTVITELVASVLFLFGLTGMAMSGIFTITRANVAVESIERLEKDMAAFSNHVDTGTRDISQSFGSINFSSVSFQYIGEKNEKNFFVGPIDLSIKQGEILFIVGGNGSGKTTLMKLLTGLYYPSAEGSILLGNRPLRPSDYPGFRGLFSVIFTDFHLFRKLYGLKTVDSERVRGLLKTMALESKTDYLDGRFTHIDLSTGQRKRLAFITAILGDKPIYVFDEWAADQAPDFRRLFYNQFLDDLRSAGKTVIAVTHDDRYFNCADRVVKMEEGIITAEYRCRNVEK